MERLEALADGRLLYRFKRPGATERRMWSLKGWSCWKDFRRSCPLPEPTWFDTNETRLGLRCPGMPSLHEPHANPRSHSSCRGETENPGLPRSTLACTTACPGRPPAFHSTGWVLNTARKPTRDSCASARAIPLDFTFRARLFVLIPRFCLLRLNITLQRRQFRRSSCHPLHCEPLLLYLSASIVHSVSIG